MPATTGSIFHAIKIGVCSADDGRVVLNLRLDILLWWLCEEYLKVPVRRLIQ